MSPVAGDVPERARSDVRSWRELRNAIDTLNQRIDNATPGGGATGSAAPGGSAGGGGVSGGGVSSGGGVTAPNDAAFILPNDSDGADDTLLANRRILTAGDNISLTDAGAGGTLTIASQAPEFPSSLVGAEFRFATVNDAEDAIEFTEFSLDFLTKTASYIMANDDSVILADAAAGPMTITLPRPADTKRRVVTIKKIDSTNNIVTISAT